MKLKLKRSIWSKSIASHETENPAVVKTEPESAKISEMDIDHYSSDDSSDHFTEYCDNLKNVKKCNSPPYHDIDAAFFNRDFKDAYVKEEIDDVDIEEHGIKLEPNDCNLESKQKKSTDRSKNVDVLKCHTCIYETSNPASLKKHLTLHQDPSTLVQYYCTQCNYRTRQKCHLKRHMLIHKHISEITSYTCDICGLKTKQKCTLRRHIGYVHFNEPRYKKRIASAGLESDYNLEEYFCNQCSYKTFKKGLLNAHMDKHKDTGDVTNLYICHICSFSTKYRRNLRVHLETHQEAEDLQVYECKLCGFKTRIGYCLKRHLLSKKHLLAAGKIEEYCPRTPKT